MSNITVIKRDGRNVDFDRQKIVNAILSAFKDVDGEVSKYAKERANNIADYVESHAGKRISVEDIQDMVEQGLVSGKRADVGKSYIIYRYEHAIARQRHNDNEIFQIINNDPNGYWSHENSNKNANLVTVQRDYLAGITSTDIARNYIFPKKVVEAHDDGIVHQHDMDYMAQYTLSNCELINLNDMLQNGTAINKVKIKKPHRLITAMTITTQIMASVAANTYGGESINLTHLAPFVRDSYNYYLKKYSDKSLGLTDKQINALADRDLKKEIQDSVQTFNYQISTLFTLNGQAPFCSVFMYLNDTEEYKNELIMLIKEFLKQRMDGMPNRDGIKVTQAFPKLLYVLEEDNYKPGTKYWPVTKMAIKCSSNRLTPDYISEKKMKEYKINGNGDGDCYACMGKRKL
jgi:anaerobic ribonucleoside-triphosphate reductase